MSELFEKTEAGVRHDGLEIIWAQNSKDFFFANSLVFHGRSPLIVDPSANLTFFERLAAGPQTFRILNTHYHTDHRALNCLFKKAEYLCHRDDAPALGSWPEFQKRLDANPSSPYSDWVRRMWLQMHLQPTPVGTLLEDEQIIESDHFKIQIIHIPGHTPGHIALHVLELGLLFTSDIDLTPFGPWYANAASNLEQFRNSIQKIRAIEVPHYVTSHGQRVYDREKFLDKLASFEKHFDRRDELILEALQKAPQSLENLASEGIIYRKPLLKDPLKAYFSLKMIEKHIERLSDLGKIHFDGTYYHLGS